MLRFLFCIRDEHETLVATLDMWKFRVVTVFILCPNKSIGSMTDLNLKKITQSMVDRMPVLLKMKREKTRHVELI